MHSWACVFRVSVPCCETSVGITVRPGTASPHCIPLNLYWQEDDYESPNEDQDGEDDGDYESPNEEETAPVEDDADYEPPPSNDEEAMQNSILPPKPLSDSMYIGKSAMHGAAAGRAGVNSVHFPDPHLG